MTSRASIPIVRTGTANLASVRAAVRRAGLEPEMTESADVVGSAERLVLPGVGAFGAVMSTLRGLGLVGPLRERIAAGRPTLCVCLGMQVLAERSEESPGVEGLGVVPGTVVKFRPPVDKPELRVPQLGWNEVRPDEGCRLLTNGHAYFANSFRLTERPEGWSAAWARHGEPFVAAVERGCVLACQFHPELSGAWGAGLIERWLAAGESSGSVVYVSTAQAPRPARTPLPRVIPCLDVRDGRVVKGIKFQGLRDAGDPVERAGAYEAQGADELVILDVSATPEGRANAAETVAAVRRVLSIPLTAGGGVRAPDDAARLLDAGADKVGVNTAAVRRPELISELAERFGVQCTILAVDAARREGPTPPDGSPWEVVVMSGTERTGIDAVQWCRRAEALGAGEVLLTSWDRDGTRSGYDCELLEAVSGAVRVPVIASGGADTVSHMQDALVAGAEAVLAASIFHDGHTTVADVKRRLGDLGVPVRGGSPTTPTDSPPHPSALPTEPTP